MHRFNAAKNIRSARQRWNRVMDELEAGRLRASLVPDELDASAELLVDVEARPSHSGRHSGALSATGTDTDHSASFFERNFVLGSGAGLQTIRSQSSPENDGKKTSWLWSPGTDLHAIYRLVTSSFINLLLLLVPLGILADYLKWGAVSIFMLNIIGIIPLALMLGDVTEDLAVRCGDIVGGLVNATFGNLVELIISIVALSRKTQKMRDVAAMSNVGSILSNLLLVLGCCFLFGGMRHKLQKFNALANQVCNSLLFLAVIALILPNTALLIPNTNFQGDHLLLFSRITAIILLLAYLAYLYFQLYSHHDMFTGEEEDDGEQAALTLTAELGILCGLSLVVSIASERITDSLSEMSESSGINPNFLSVILLPVAGNAVEHITAVMVALRNKMDLALGIAIGSTLQIALFVIPCCVLSSWAMGNPFTLDFNVLGSLSIMLSVIHANFITSGGTSHWLMGVQLLCTYVLIGLAFFFM